jgi:hypothetical protein
MQTKPRFNGTIVDKILVIDENHVRFFIGYILT